MQTAGRGTLDITHLVAEVVEGYSCTSGLANVFLQHTSASLILCENADPQVRRDLEAWLSRAIPDADPLFLHTQEGPDDMPAHVRSVLTATSLNIPIVQGRLALGTWQGLYLYEHRTAPHCRQVWITLLDSA